MADAWPRRAVVDIGSNSVRLVIFSGPPRVPVTIVNEKALCGLGDRHPETGNLREEAVDLALATLRRFVLIIEAERPESLDVFATAAVRDAPNGRGFLDDIREIGLDPRLISGDEESRLAGLGILCSAPEIMREGLTALGGDLGGGSLELSKLSGPVGTIDEVVSLPIGSLRLTMEYAECRDDAKTFVDQQFANLPWLSTLQQTELFVVGGAWRAIARVGMWLAKHPVPILDHYKMPSDQVFEVCRFVEDAPPEELGKIGGVQRKRVPTLPMASIVLRRLLDVSGARSVTVSSCGVREGLLFDKLPLRLRTEEPLFVLAKDLAQRQSGGRLPSVEAVSAFTDSLFTDSPSELRLRRAAAMMIRMANIAHPDQRAEHVAATVMASPFLGIDHVERALLALMMAVRFNSSVNKAANVIPISVLAEDQCTYAVQVGRAHRLASTLRTPIYDQNSGFRIEKASDRITLHVSPRVNDLITDQAVKDLDRLAEAFSLPAETIHSEASS
ncbi:MAG: hypothetical protein AAF830_06510 [Pseudomonadota bacterium]